MVVERAGEGGEVWFHQRARVAKVALWGADMGSRCVRDCNQAQTKGRNGGNREVLGLEVSGQRQPRQSSAVLEQSSAAFWRESGLLPLFL